MRSINLQCLPHGLWYMGHVYYIHRHGNKSYWKSINYNSPYDIWVMTINQSRMYHKLIIGHGRRRIILTFGIQYFTPTSWMAKFMCVGEVSANYYSHLPFTLQFVLPDKYSGQTSTDATCSVDTFISTVIRWVSLLHMYSEKEMKIEHEEQKAWVISQVRRTWRSLHFHDKEKKA